MIPAQLFEPLHAQQGIVDDGLFVDRVHAGLVQGHGVEGSEHTDVRHDGRVVVAVAIAEGGDVDDHVDVEIGLSLIHI